MLKRTLTVLSALIPLLVPGCAQKTESEQLRADTPLQFELTTEPQIAVFKTERGWTGGMGDPVLLGKRRQVRVNGLRVVLAYGTMDEIEKEIEKRVKLPNCVRGEEIIVKAQIHLEKRTERNSSIEGNHRETIYRCFIDELLDVAWTGESCD